MKRVNFFKLSASALLVFSLLACDPSTVEGKAEKYNKIMLEAKKLEQEGKSDMAQKKEAEAFGYALKVIEEYGEKMDLKNLEEFNKLTKK